MSERQALKLSEGFYSVQAEGVTTGIPAYFIRLEGCNLICGGPGGSLMAAGKATWWCDTEAVWRQGTDLSYKGLELMFKQDNQLQNIIDGRTNLIWTGGEPTMERNRNDIMGFLRWFYDRHPGSEGQVFNEVETNGTVYCADGFFDWMQQINCSAKLSNCGMKEKARIKEDVIRQIDAHPNSWFKFVISSPEDIAEFERDYIEPFDLDPRKIVIMPGLDKAEDAAERTAFLYEMSKQYGYRGITRGHIVAWDRTTGV